MHFRDVPNLSKFEQYARLHSDDEIIMDCYRRIRDLITPVPAPADGIGLSNSEPVEGLKASCEAIEKSTRLLWACAVATNNVAPAMWEYQPDYAASLEYFLALEDLELMAVTKRHRLTWEESSRLA